jgi:hypothetical protein
LELTDAPSNYWSEFTTVSGYSFILTIDNTNIDEDLTEFPMKLVLSSSAGSENQDVSHVFDILGDDSKKLMVQTVSGTQCYVEIESWDSSSESAVLHVKVPHISSETNTELYFVYNADWTDNSEFVGDTGSTAAKAVWDSNFLGVWHMAQEPDGVDSILDSTSNEFHGTPSAGVDKTTNGLNFTSADEDYLTIPQSSAYDFVASTFEAHCKATAWGGNSYGYLMRIGDPTSNTRQELYLDGAGDTDINI